ncbi:hypothetical protein [Streptosporangium sp. NPDC048865]|uniref:hypothetical protein n=1 Tax=Streptosporangium sp. NPDC048865 TaxID=3155766 RepID=UPI003443705A
MTSIPWGGPVTFAAAPARRLVTLGVALTVGATLLGAPAAGAAAPPEGAYWHTKELEASTHPWRFGTASAPYSLVQRRIAETWSAPDGRSWMGHRDLGWRPTTAADRRAWRRDGSPSTWRESVDGKRVKLSAKPAKGLVGPVRQERNQFRFAGQWLTYDEIQRLPADPGRLKDWLTRAGQAGQGDSGAGWLRNTLPGLLYDVPAPKEVRTAAYQALLTLPGVRAHGDAKDNLGRPGMAIVIDRRSEPENKTQPIMMSPRLIVDTGRMVLLSREQTVTFRGRLPPQKLYTTLIEVGWTDSRPAAPALP